MRFSLLAVAAALTALSNAYTQPQGDQPDGNPINKPGLNEQVPIGKPYEIQWQPTTPQDGTVTLLLLRGPGDNIKPLYPIAEKIPNSGSYSWTPANDLQADTTHYGIQLIVDANGQYQYTSQFGLSAATPDSGNNSNYTKPVGPNPSGNPLTKPAAGEIVPAGAPYQVTWQPTTPQDGTVTLLLLRGPATNLEVVRPIAQKIPNSGSFSWTPSIFDAFDHKNDYAIQLVVDADGSYQYTGQFGVGGIKRPLMLAGEKRENALPGNGTTTMMPSGTAPATSSTSCVTTGAATSSGAPVASHTAIHTGGAVKIDGVSLITVAIIIAALAAF